VTDTEQYKADIRITGEKIVEIGLNLPDTGENVQEIDASGLTVFPGGIDPHVHLSLPAHIPELYQWADNFESGSKAALAGGITTLGCMSVPESDETPLGTLNRETEAARKLTIADILIHPIIESPNTKKLQEFPQLVEQGCTSIKVFMSTEDFDRNPLEYLKVLEAAKKAGILTMIHCEDYAILTATRQALMADGRGSLAYYAESRPIISEVVATQRAVAMSEVYNTPIYVVHISSERALRVCEEAQARSLPIYVEGRPIFLYLTREQYNGPEGPLYMVGPALREASDIAALWEGIDKGSIHVIATDHAPHTREHKFDPSLNVANPLAGINELQVMLPMLHSKGVLNHRISLKQLIKLTSTNPAKLFGLYPRKGTIQVDSDADLVIWDLTEKWEVKKSELFSKAGFSIYEGMTLIGRPQMTIRRGKVVYDRGKITAQPGSGQVVLRGHSQAIHP